MKKIFILTIAINFLFVATAFAANNNSNGQQTDNQLQNQDRTHITTTSISTPSQIQNQSQTQTQTQTQTTTSQGNYTNDTNTSQQQYMNQEFQTTQTMLNLSNEIEDEGLKEQLQSMIQQQNANAQTSIQTMEKIQTRNRIIKFLIGIDYQQAENAQQAITQNQLRIQELEQLSTQISNSTLKEQLRNQIQQLKQQNTNLQNQLNQTTQTFSLFGWLIKLFNK